MYRDKTVLIVRPSQWINLGWFIGSVVAFVFLLRLDHPSPFVPLMPLGTALWKYLEVKFLWYEFGEETIIERRGVLNVTRSEVHYYRIKSILVDEPLLYRIVGISKLHMVTSDQFTKSFSFIGIPEGNKLREEIREMVFIHRKNKDVKEFDLFNL